MASTRDHRYSDGDGFGDPYDGFDLDPPELRTNTRLVDPTDDYVLSDIVDESQVVPEHVDVLALIEIGLTYVAIEEFEQAIDSFARAIAYADEDSHDAQEAWVNKGVAHAQLAEYDEAIGAAREALRIDDDNEFAATAETNLAYALWEFGDSSEPLDHAERAVELDPREPHAWYNRGFFLAERGQYEAAVRCFDTAISLGLRDASVVGERERAIEKLEEQMATEHEPETADIERTVETDGDGDGDGVRE
ncbi:tetratricopeptide repeat protein [Haloferax sp. MBLA0076]|uniref:Tetratricopeptide repeat protein n=1 Tax=Haloferax litoreum TaxID=2666140 RepID=A0A6A8GI56_9EURY|nr:MULTISPECIES: tetratricopeptide repeat protein [Haloferax]KAB1193304.1 tetratricopeptide repeat protein [Haloferax sp. CBA1148]MRX21807.1 tetratricopeptide repeat protein [Haloferax litoreum]